MSSNLLPMPLRTVLARPTASHSPARSTCHGAARAFGMSSALLATGYPYQGVPRDSHGLSMPIPKPSSKSPEIPPYPYGPRRVYKQSNGGLYGSSRIQFGNNVSEKHNVKTPRKWRPNVQRRRLWSDSLRCFVQTKVTTSVLRTIDKAGGLDNYLLGDKTQRIKELGPWGWKLRWRIMQSETVEQRFAAERMALGLPPKSPGVLQAEALREATLMGLIPAGAPAQQTQQLMAETQQVIDGDRDFVIGKDEGFMKEQAP
ncbi:54S ribosomal protein L24 [Diaporthe helianthi]|uniref:Large ribosomal subunit protein bL28m n=1 Tax=Diaporthe helianthi TaxID=158607 RepID=A0A2P5HHN4_DIAHE|nr:54S ribosomal protein L24 [Diaporthe helianthi]